MVADIFLITIGFVIFYVLFIGFFFWGFRQFKKGQRAAELREAQDQAELREAQDQAELREAHEPAELDEKLNANSRNSSSDYR